MKQIMMPVCLAALFAAAIGCNSSSTESHMDSASTTMNNTVDSMQGAMNSNDDGMTKDQHFAMEAASGGLMEVELGNIAATNASSAKVKEFGNMMVTDHSKANDELKSIAAAKSITLPASPMPEQQKMIDELKEKKGADFDKAYMDMMEEDHKEDISKFEEESNNGNDAELKAFATKALPVLNKHLESVKSIRDGMK